LEFQGKRLFGPHFRIYREDHDLILSLLVYAIADKESCQARNLRLKKGILLTGPIGCGKTSLMTLINFFFPGQQQYQIKSTRDISFEFEKEGYKVINRYSTGSKTTTAGTTATGIFCFDDLGTEQPQKYFGNECNVMAEILLSRYDLFVSKGIPTHVTTNLSASELEEKYGNRLRSRMREMFNLVAFDKNSRDKRS
jgi:energy-coupling factor transporter ATP-binding protein EcfA2